MFCSCGSRSDGINKGEKKKTGSQQKTGKRDGHSAGMADRCYLSLRPVGLGLGKGVKTSVPVGGVSGRLFAMVLDSQDFGYPPIFRDALSVGGAAQWLQASVPEIWHFQIGEKCKVCISGTEGRRDSGTSLACSACSNYVRPIAFSSVYDVRFRSYGR